MSKSKTSSSEGSSFAPEWLAANAARARALVDEAGDRGADLVSAWIACKNAAAVAAIAADDAAPSPARKAARRGVNVLKSRGIAVPAAERAARASAPETKETYEAWFR